MKPEQIYNLLEFTSIFLSGGLKLKLESTDYYREKYDKYIGMPIKKHTETCDKYEEWSDIWGKSDDVNTIFLYLNEIINCGVKRKNNFNTDNQTPKPDHWLTYITPDELLYACDKYFGDPEEINKRRYNFVHPIVKEKIYDVWIKKNKRLFKLLRIVEE